MLHFFFGDNEWLFKFSGRSGHFDEIHGPLVLPCIANTDTKPFFGENTRDILVRYVYSRVPRFNIWIIDTVRFAECGKGPQAIESLQSFIYEIRYWIIVN
jgi:hypothetical protein